MYVKVAVENIWCHEYEIAVIVINHPGEGSTEVLMGAAKRLPARIPCDLK